MSRRAILAVVCIALAVALYFFGQSQAPQRQAAREAVPSAEKAAEAFPAPAVAKPGGASDSAVGTSQPPTVAKPASAGTGAPTPLVQPAIPPVVDGTTPTAPGGPPVSERDVAEDLDNVQFALRDFRSALGENPVGNNAEITKTLLGDNARQVKIPLPPGSQTNDAGELTDRWGTPYFFHQLSGTEMEVRSAGPDKKMWTPDDKVSK